MYDMKSLWIWHPENRGFGLEKQDKILLVLSKFTSRTHQYTFPVSPPLPFILSQLVLFTLRTILRSYHHLDPLFRGRIKHILRYPCRRGSPVSLSVHQPLHLNLKKKKFKNTCDLQSNFISRKSASSYIKFHLQTGTTDLDHQQQNNDENKCLTVTQTTRQRLSICSVSTTHY